MKQFIGIFIICIFFSDCSERNKCYQQTGTVNKTEEYKLKNMGWINLKDKERVDGYTRMGDSIFGGETACNLKPLKGIDIDTFSVLAGTQYAKDKNHVYYPLEVICTDYSAYGVCHYVKIIVKNANPSSFSYLGKEYATDGQNVYFRGELIDEADGATFKVINGPQFFFFATDKKSVYKHKKIFTGADPNTFYYDKYDSRNIDKEYIQENIIGDKTNEWKFIPPDSIQKVEKR